MTDAGPTGCALAGDYEVTVSGGMYYFRFRSDGTFVIAGLPADLATSTMGGTYTYVGTTMTINEDFGCMITDTGTYTVMWDATCDVFTLALVSDPCTIRTMTLTMSTATRL
ncbi:MAG: hypothetical protein AB7S26_16150 [Sandaracinaceae bacterium]